MCKVTYILRAAALYVDALYLRGHDVQLQNSLSNLLGVEIPAESMIQASCSVRNEGLGLRRASDLALPAFIASVFKSRSRSIRSSLQIGTVRKRTRKLTN